ncbi:MAG: SDR family NAD(P)-dependent oxidoreductase [Proteobacteria bacterium]|nr:SDR family NAD(P)-dependent oxidoreductase [Pseudomonadota bacterium]
MPDRAASRSLRGASVLVTGADGFIGSHLTELLVAAGANVRALVYYNSWNETGWLKSLPADVLAQVELFPGDIRDADRVAAAVADRTHVFHLSSLVAIPYSYDAPRSYVETNVNGAVNIAQACRNSDSLVRLVHVSTSEVYGTARTVPISESHPVTAQSPYAATKIAADKMIESFHLSFGLPVVTARPFNTFGPRQTARAVIPTIASQLLSHCAELRLGALTPTRDFVYVTDTAQALADLALCPAAEGEVVNIGAGREWSIGDVARLLMDITGHRCEIVSDQDRLRPDASEVQRLLADASRLRALTGWEPKVPFEQGLKNTAAWITDNLDRFDPARFAR